MVPMGAQVRPKGPKVIPFASKITFKMDPKVIKIPTSMKNLFLEPLSSQMLVFGVPDTPESDQKSSKKVT